MHDLWLFILHIIQIQCFFQIAKARTASGKQAGEERVEPRFFLWYWYTSTATATKTTFTTTKTFTLTVCTPTTGFSYAGKLYTEIGILIQNSKNLHN